MFTQKIKIFEAVDGQETGYCIECENYRVKEFIIEDQVHYQIAVHHYAEDFFIEKFDTEGGR